MGGHCKIDPEVVLVDESDTLCYHDLVQLCYESAGGTKMDPVQSVPFCFTREDHNPIRNAPNLALNKMASLQMRLID